MSLNYERDNFSMYLIYPLDLEVQCSRRGSKRVVFNDYQSPFKHSGVLSFYISAPCVYI